MDHKQPSTPDALAAIQASIERLAAAGLIEILDYDPVADRGTMRFHPAYHRLLMAGVDPFASPEFRAIVDTGDLVGARQWIEARAMDLDEPAPRADEDDRDG